ncbi:radical SAM family heme chaperone HemW [uncultured Parasphingopyxis sp.]|uniref:radical SAM family heme chaperone HemW n=1 Tax=uncultured Parasphingopyxis sp. TaxID=1547918 RepID=UPI00260D22FF|nr:radical SAM family heme chaperone HemW [uncultured Parasphingopyxis sp.]
MDMNATPPVDSGKTRDIALYIHWPFCLSKCPYCDFNSHVRADIDQAAWKTALLADLAHEAAELPGRRLVSIFFGGGTPSLMAPETVQALIDAASGHWKVADVIEITLEANPTSVEAARFGDLAHAGINRVSLGLQSLDDETLRFLGREHSVGEGLAALDIAQAVFDRVSFDLIYATPEQSEPQWRDQLSRAIGFGTSHLSLYQLTIEPGTRFESDVRKGAFAPMDDDRAAALFETTQELTEGAALPTYEISNHARLGEESRHNLIYWRYGDYAGVGPGAHGRRGGMATVRHRKPENWLTAVERNGHGMQREDTLTDRERAVEALMMGLRLREGIARDSLAARAIDEQALKRLVSQGLLTVDGNRIATSPQGRLVLNGLIAELVSEDMLAA